MTMKKVPFHPS